LGIASRLTLEVWRSAKGGVSGKNSEERIGG